jgi:hypothetical protein
MAWIGITALFPQVAPSYTQTSALLTIFVKLAKQATGQIVWRQIVAAHVRRGGYVLLNSFHTLLGTLAHAARSCEDYQR